mmetsp:Transcript_27802/g.44512  ORF Transcript_27802/g.44512 Transcript_27802/m.44512 type:complete len:208 (-) Transcript_27802:4755-5378(-)
MLLAKRRSSTGASRVPSANSPGPRDTKRPVSSPNIRKNDSSFRSKFPKEPTKSVPTTWQTLCMKDSLEIIPPKASLPRASSSSDASINITIARDFSLFIFSTTASRAQVQFFASRINRRIHDFRLSQNSEYENTSQIRSRQDHQPMFMQNSKPRAAIFSGCGSVDFIAISAPLRFFFASNSSELTNRLRPARCNIKSPLNSVRASGP